MPEYGNDSPDELFITPLNHGIKQKKNKNKIRLVRLVEMATSKFILLQISVGHRIS